MRLDTIHSLIIVAMVALATQITRWTPFLLFSGDKKLPKVVEDLGRLLPPAMMGLLVVYSLRSTDLLGGSHGIPEAIAVAVTAGLHLWRRNTLLSILAGTVCYMLLVQNRARHRCRRMLCVWPCKRAGWRRRTWTAPSPGIC